MVDQAVVGEGSTRSIGNAGTTNLRSGNMGDLIISELHGRYYEANYRARRFGGAMQAVLATATIAGLSASITGVSVLANPIGNSFNLSLEFVGIGFVLAPAAPLVYGIATGFNATTNLAGTVTSLNPKSKLVGGLVLPTAVLAASAAITLPTVGTVDTVLGTLDTGAVTTVTNTSGLFDIEGGILIPPGGYAYLWTSAVLAASAHIMSWEWEEVPV